MIRKALLVGVYCFVTGNAWVCVAHDRAPQCKIEHEYKGCSADEIAADTVRFCADDGQGQRITGVTTTTIPTSVGGAFPTPCQPPVTVTVCQWTSRNGKYSKHCTITDGVLTSRCGGMRTRRDGSRVARGCVTRGF